MVFSLFRRGADKAPVAQSIPPAPPGFDKDKFLEGVYWHQRWQIFKGIFTPGINPVAEMFDWLHVPGDLSGKRVLDIGAWNGCMSFECERRGAREVVAVGPEDPNQTAFYRIRDAIGSTRTQYRRGSVYDLSPEEYGYFDVILFCGVLYHLRYPLLGIDNLRRVCTGDVYVETHLIDNEFIFKEGGELKKVPLKAVSPLLPANPIWQFYRRDELIEDSNWFGPNATAVVQAFESAGFATEFLNTWGSRGMFHGRIKEGAPEFLTICCGEAVYYDVLIKHLFTKEKARSPAA